MAQWVARLQPIEERLRPIATRGVDILATGWRERLRARRPPDEAALGEEAAVREEAHALLGELVEAYPKADEAGRAAIRRLMREFPRFAWAATLSVPRTTADGFHARLVHFAMADQGPDPRDATMWIDRITLDAQDAGLDVPAILREVAGLASHEDPYGWGSTAEWLLRRAGHPLRRRTPGPGPTA